jgi:hypothetical protein
MSCRGKSVIEKFSAPVVAVDRVVRGWARIGEIERQLKDADCRSAWHLQKRLEQMNSTNSEKPLVRQKTKETSEMNKEGERGEKKVENSPLDSKALKLSICLDSPRCLATLMEKKRPTAKKPVINETKKTKTKKQTKVTYRCW